MRGLVQASMEAALRSLEEQVRELTVRLDETTRVAQRFRAQNQTLTREIPARIEVLPRPGMLTLCTFKSRHTLQPRAAVLAPHTRRRVGQGVETAYREQVEKLRLEIAAARASQAKILRFLFPGTAATAGGQRDSDNKEWRALAASRLRLQCTR